MYIPILVNNLFDCFLYFSFFFCLFMFRCMCPSGYTGQNCENEYIPCDPSPCQNGGSCRSIDELEYQCLCPEGECDPSRIYFFSSSSSFLFLAYLNARSPRRSTQFHERRKISYLSAGSFRVFHHLLWPRPCPWLDGPLLGRIFQVAYLYYVPFFPPPPPPLFILSLFPFNLLELISDRFGICILKEVNKLNKSSS